MSNLDRRSLLLDSVIIPVACRPVERGLRHIRPSLLGHVAGATVAFAIVTQSLRPSPEPDAILIALCATFGKACGEIHRLNALKGASDADGCSGRSLLGSDRGYYRAPATTAAGIHAKAQAVIGLFAGGAVQRYLHQTVEEAAGRHEILAWRLAHEIVAMGGVV